MDKFEKTHFLLQSISDLLYPKKTSRVVIYSANSNVQSSWLTL